MPLFGNLVSVPGPEPRPAPEPRPVETSTLSRKLTERALKVFLMLPSVEYSAHILDETLQVPLGSNVSTHPLSFFFFLLSLFVFSQLTNFALLHLLCVMSSCVRVCVVWSKSVNVCCSIWSRD